MGRSFVMAVALFGCFCLGGGTAHAQGSDRVARAHFEDGRAAYEAGRFAEAATSFEQAYRLTNRAALLYNIYLAYRDAGDDVHAADAMRRYLATLPPDASERTQLEARLRVHEQRIAAATNSTDTHQTGPETTEPTGTDVDADVAPSDTHTPDNGGGDTRIDTNDSPSHDAANDASSGMGAIPWIVAGSGAALVVGGLIVGAIAMSTKSELDELCPTMTTCAPGYESVQSRGQTLATVSDVLWIGGAVVAVTGLVLAIVDAGSSSDEPPTSTASAGCTTDGCGVSIMGRF